MVGIFCGVIYDNKMESYGFYSHKQRSLVPKLLLFKNSLGESALVTETGGFYNEDEALD